MKNQETKRVLGRIGARELTPQEVDGVGGGGTHITYPISGPPPAGSPDVDGTESGSGE